MVSRPREIELEEVIGPIYSMYKQLWSTLTNRKINEFKTC